MNARAIVTACDWCGRRPALEVPLKEDGPPRFWCGCGIGGEELGFERPDCEWPDCEGVVYEVDPTFMEFRCIEHTLD